MNRLSDLVEHPWDRAYIRAQLHRAAVREWAAQDHMRSDLDVQASNRRIRALRVTWEAMVGASDQPGEFTLSGVPLALPTAAAGPQPAAGPQDHDAADRPFLIEAADGTQERFATWEEAVAEHGFTWPSGEPVVIHYRPQPPG